MANFFQKERGGHPLNTPFSAAVLGMVNAFRPGPGNRGCEFSEMDRVLAARARRREAHANADRLLL